MSRLRDAILDNQNSYARERQNPMLDLQYGGMMGYAPDLTEWVSNQAYVRRNLICLLIEAPRGFNYLPNKDSWVRTLRALVELHALSIDGLQAGLEVEFTSNPVGGGGEIQEDFVDVKQAVSNPVFRWTEKYGMPIQTFLRGWVTYLMMDPNSKFANIATLSGSRPTDMLSDMTAATMLFLEPDPTHTKVVKSWLCTNMMPKNTGEVIGRRDLTQAAEATTYDIPFTSIAQYGLGVDIFAQKMLDAINITNANPYLRPAFVDGISADVAGARGYESATERLGATAVRQ